MPELPPQDRVSAIAIQIILKSDSDAAIALIERIYRHTGLSEGQNFLDEANALRDKFQRDSLERIENQNSEIAAAVLEELNLQRKAVGLPDLYP